MRKRKKGEKSGRRAKRRRRRRTERNNGISEKPRQEYRGKLRKVERKNDGRHKSGKYNHKRTANK